MAHSLQPSSDRQGWTRCVCVAIIFSGNFAPEEGLARSRYMLAFGMKLKWVGISREGARG